MTRLAPVLHAGDLPLAELCAARLDGEVVAVDECYCPIDELIVARHRADALSRCWPERLIAEQRTAAWIWGAATDPPAKHQWCASTTARARPPVPSRGSVREVVIASDEIATIARLRLTTPLRTAVDMARFSPRFDGADERVVAALISGFGLSLADCRAALHRRRNLPNKNLAWSRLERVAGMLEGGGL
ncbi:MAG: hypothetical protein JWM51_965 [Microbacteriaceae bacterium]|jgi:hypothetical protein|nr:hypothetical protein [Microbacteriaceae bacterium]